MRTAATTAVVAGTATAVSGRVARRQQSKAEAEAAQSAPPPAEEPPAAAPPAAPEKDMATQLRELAELKDQGILTEEEFAAQKAKILGS